LLSDIGTESSFTMFKSHVCCRAVIGFMNDPRSEIWEAVQQVNEYYALHSRILQSMIYVLPLPEGEKLPVTPKGNAKRIMCKFDGRQAVKGTVAGSKSDNQS
jgi:hypothetical protein